MLIKTLDTAKGLVNGARGVIKSFTGSGRYPVVQFVNGNTMTIRKEVWNVIYGGRTVATRDQIPLDLAWAISVHKSQVREWENIQHIPVIFHFLLEKLRG